MEKITRVIEAMDMPSNVSVKTNIRGVRIIRAVDHIPLQPVFHDPGILVLLKGRKTVSLGGVRFPYDADNYLVVSINVPFETEVFASPESPVIGMAIDVDMAQLHDLIAIVGHQPAGHGKRGRGRPKAVEPARMGPLLRNAIERMAGCLTSVAEARALGPGLVREVLFRALTGPQAAALYALADHSGSFARIAGVLRIMQSRYAEKIDVGYLAREAGMGSSSFHQAFKEATSDTPMQYLKKLRLTKARELILRTKEKAHVAASSVGYESASQFSREFKRFFGDAPSALGRR